GPDAALRPRPALARTDGAADGLRCLGLPGATARRPGGARGRAGRVGAAGALRAGAARARGERALRLSGGIPRSLLREAALPVRPARALRADVVPRAGARGRRARRRAGASHRPRSGGRVGGTGLPMQGGHDPDLGVDYYEDLFSSIKARYPIHLHALSPPEIQHIARRSKLTLWQTISRLRDAGLDSIPGGGGEILVDRVRDDIAPKKTKTNEWLAVMRHAHRLGMSTTATMMYGH